MQEDAHCSHPPHMDPAHGSFNAALPDLPSANRFVHCCTTERAAWPGTPWFVPCRATPLPQDRTVSFRFGFGAHNYAKSVARGAQHPCDTRAGKGTAQNICACLCASTSRPPPVCPEPENAGGWEVRCAAIAIRIRRVGTMRGGVSCCSRCVCAFPLPVGAISPLHNPPLPSHPPNAFASLRCRAASVTSSQPQQMQAQHAQKLTVRIRHCWCRISSGHGGRSTDRSECIWFCRFAM
jgi:hypothetical protein